MHLSLLLLHLSFFYSCIFSGETSLKQRTVSARSLYEWYLSMYYLLPGFTQPSRDLKIFRKIRLFYMWEITEAILTFWSHMWGFQDPPDILPRRKCCVIRCYGTGWDIFTVFSSNRKETIIKFVSMKRRKPLRTL